MRLEDVAPGALEELVEDLADLQHDLGKYITFEARFAGEDPDRETLSRALWADLLATRRQGEQVQNAWQVWQSLRPAQLGDDPDVALIDQRITALQAFDPAGPLDVLRVHATSARDVAAATRRLAQRARDLLSD